jgi:hypothetical protein
MQSDGGHGDNGTPLGRGGRSRPSEFLPPRSSGAASRGVHGSRGGCGSRGCRGSRGGDSSSLNIGSRSGRQPLGMVGEGRGRSLANLARRGSTGVTSSSLPADDAGGHDGITEEDENGSQMVRIAHSACSHDTVLNNPCLLCMFCHHYLLCSSVLVYLLH